MDDYYNKTALSYNELHREEQVAKAKIILNEILKKKSNGILLDIGGGTGISTEIFTKNFECVLVDPSERLLEQAPSNIVKILAEAEELPFTNKKFDVIISITALHHADLEKSLKEIKRVSKENTLVAITFLKKSKKLEEFRRLFKKIYNSREIEESKDIIFFNF
ncbi:MAG: class I SAM-dependent methyltransferase [Nanoarchaeota archaeon]|nr:class I SAM-dependent methyltransferase [Nanoarchaeota archaeon]